MAPKTCVVDECERQAKSRGWCHTHYVYWHRTGNAPSGQVTLHVRGAIAKRIDARTDRSGGPSACHIWEGYKNENGYGILRVKGRGQLVHRLAYEESGRTIPPGHVVDHKCSTPACVNPNHLRACRQKQNMENLRNPYVNSTSGVRGVSWHSGSKKWRAHVTHNRRTQHLGLFATIEEAERVVIAKRLELFTHNDADRT